MKKSDFIKLHKSLTISLPKTKEINPLPSATDPTQDIPIRMIEVSANGEPINVRKSKLFFSGVSADNLSSVDCRNNDHFDMLNEYQKLSKSVSRKGITVNKK